MNLQSCKPGAAMLAIKQLDCTLSNMLAAEVVSTGHSGVTNTTSLRFELVVYASNSGNNDVSATRWPARGTPLAL